MTSNPSIVVKTAFIFLAAVGGARSASIDTVSFAQLDWYDGSGALFGPNSLWGAFDYHTVPDPTNFYYINMVARSGGTGSGNWVVQNLPIFPTALNTVTDQEMYFDLSELGISDGTRLASLDYYVSVDASPLATVPAGAFSTAPVPTVERRATDGPDPIVGGPGAPPGHKSAGPVTYSGSHHDLDEVEEGQDQCMAGAFARSIKWLDKKYDLPQLPATDTVQEVYDHLASEFATKTKEADRISTKAYYLKFLDSRASTKVVDLATLGDVPGATMEKPKDLIDWIKREMETEDVEISYKINSQTGHIAALAEFYVQDGASWVRYRDDSNQNRPGGDKKEKEAKIVYDPNYRDFYFGRFQIQYVVSESVVPEPSMLLLTSLGLLIVPLCRWRRSSGGRDESVHEAYWPPLR